MTDEKRKENKANFYWNAMVTTIVLGFMAVVLGITSGQIEIIKTSPYKQPPRSLSEVGAEPNDCVVWESLGHLEVTAYCKCELCCGEYANGITANGHTIIFGDRFVAAPKLFPFNYEIIVDGYNNNKPVKVLDRGGAITIGYIDVYFDTHDKALEWGRRKNTEIWAKRYE